MNLSSAFAFVNAFSAVFNSFVSSSTLTLSCVFVASDAFSFSFSVARAELFRKRCVHSAQFTFKLCVLASDAFRASVSAVRAKRVSVRDAVAFLRLSSDAARFERVSSRDALLVPSSLVSRAFSSSDAARDFVLSVQFTCKVCVFAF